MFSLWDPVANLLNARDSACRRSHAGYACTYDCTNIYRDDDDDQGCNTRGLRATIARGPKNGRGLTGPENAPPASHGAQNCASGIRHLTVPEIAALVPKMGHCHGASEPRKFDWPRNFIDQPRNAGSKTVCRILANFSWNVCGTTIFFIAAKRLKFLNQFRCKAARAHFRKSRGPETT